MPLDVKNRRPEADKARMALVATATDVSPVKALLIGVFLGALLSGPLLWRHRRKIIKGWEGQLGIGKPDGANDVSPRSVSGPPGVAKPLPSQPRSKTAFVFAASTAALVVLAGIGFGDWVLAACGAASLLFVVLGYTLATR